MGTIVDGCVLRPRPKESIANAERANECTREGRRHWNKGAAPLLRAAMSTDGAKEPVRLSPQHLREFLDKLDPSWASKVNMLV